jgi:hypothetical protein
MCRSLVAAFCLLALGVGGPTASASDKRAKSYAHMIIRTWDSSIAALERKTGGDGVVQRREMVIHQPCPEGLELIRDARRFFDRIDGRGAPRDRRGQFGEALRFMLSFDRNRNGLSNGEVTNAGTRYNALVKVGKCQ